MSANRQNFYFAGKFDNQIEQFNKENEQNKKIKSQTAKKMSLKKNRELYESKNYTHRLLITFRYVPELKP